MLVFELRCAATITLLSLLEGCNDPSRPKLIASAICFTSVQRILDSVWDMVKVLAICPVMPSAPRPAGRREIAGSRSVFIAYNAECRAARARVVQSRAGTKNLREATRI